MSEPSSAAAKKKGRGVRLRELFRALRDDSGQAMAEYAIINFVILVSLIVMGTTTAYLFLPDFIKSLQRYYDSFYILLNLPVP